MHLRNRPFKDGLGGTEPAYISDSDQLGVRFSRGGGPMIATIPVVLDGFITVLVARAANKAVMGYF